MINPYIDQDTYYISTPPLAQILLRCLIIFGPAVLLAGIVLWRTREKGSQAGLTITAWSMVLPSLFAGWIGWESVSDTLKFGGEINLFLIGVGFSVASLLVPWAALLTLGFFVGRHFHRRRVAAHIKIASFE